MLNASRLVVRVRKNDYGVVCNVSRPQCLVNSNARALKHEVHRSGDKPFHVGAERNMTTPEIDELDGFKFVAFERLDQMNKYVEEFVQRPPFPRHRSGIMKKVGKRTNSALVTVPVSPSFSSSSKSRPTKTTNCSKKLPILTKHKRRLRKSDKRVVAERVHGFTFLSAFSVTDFDEYDREVAGLVEMSTPAKQKSSPLGPPFSVTKKVNKKSSCVTPKQFDKMSDSWEPETSQVASSSSTKLRGKPFSKHTVKTFSNHAGKNKITSSRPGIDHVKKLNMSVSSPSSAGISQLKTLPFGRSLSRKRLAETTLDATKNKKKKGKRHPHMQIDYPVHNRTASSSGSDESVIVMSDEHDLEESTVLDVCGVDDDSSSAWFIQQSIKEKRGKKVSVEEEHKPNKGKSNKKKRCKTCCANPCRIVEARKVGPLWGSNLPSYKVSCVTTCKLHPPGEIKLYPNCTKNGFVDTSIQTNANDIRMHQDFARRFAHHAMAVTSNGPRTMGIPKPKVEKVAPELPLSKSEHHRTSEQKRREMMHESFTELRRVISISQAIPDNGKISKQWILEHAKKVITTLDADSILLSAMKENLRLKNEKLKKRWKELSGREFDPSVSKVSAEGSGQTKLMNLYKQYRENVQKEVGTKDVLKRIDRNSLAHPSVVFAEKVLSQTTLEKKLSDTHPMDKPSETVAARQPGQTTSVSKPSQATSRSTRKPSQSPSANKSSHVTPLNQSSQATCTIASKAKESTSVSKSIHVTTLNQSRQSTCTVMSQPNQVITVSKSSHDTTQNQSSQATCAVGSQPNHSSAVKKSSEVTVVNKTSEAILYTRQSGTLSVDKQSNLVEVGAPKHSIQTPVNKPHDVMAVTKPGHSPFVNKMSHVVAVRIPSQAITVNNSSLTVPVRMASQTPAVNVPVSCQAIPLNRPSTSNSLPVNTPNQTTTMRMPTQAITINKLHHARTVPASILVPSHTIAMPNQPIPLQMASQSIPLSQPIHYMNLKKQSQPTNTSKLTQWTGVSEVTSPMFNKVPVEELGAFVEVGDTTGQPSDENQVDHNEIVLLDVAQTKDIPASTADQGQVKTLSLIPTSSCINVTLRSVGSITCNRIFNQKPVPSKPKSSAAHQGWLTNHKPTSEPNTVPEYSISKQEIGATPSIHSTPGPSCGQVLATSDTLLTKKCQDGENVIDSANEPGLCVISNVFSLSDAKAAESSNNNQPVTCITTLNNTLNEVHSYQDKLGPSKCEKPENAKLAKSQVNSDGDLTMHDHNYFTFEICSQSDENTV